MNDQLERELTRDLHRQVDGMTTVPFGLDDVKGRAGTIRRNRRIAVGVGLAAAVAVIVPTAISGTTLPSGKDEIQPAPSPTATTAPVEVARTTLTLDGIQRGSDPLIEYYSPAGVTFPGGETRSLPERYQALVPGTGDGWIALGPATDEVVYLTEDFERDGWSPSGSELVTTPERDYVAWTVPLSGRPVQTIFLRSTSRPEETMTWELPAQPAVEPVGILGPDRVVYETVASPGAEETVVGIANPDGTTTELPYLGAQAVDPVNGLVAVQTSSTLSTGCFAVVEVATGQPAWETCDYRLGTFSPDGRHVMASYAEADGLGPTSLFVLDALTGDLVAEFKSEGRDVVSLIGPGWESDDSLVATASQGNETTMIRMGVDGTLEEVAERVDGTAFDDVHYILGADRRGL